MGKTSKHVVVSWNSAMSKWDAQVRLNLKLNHLGFFLDEEEAHRAVIRFKVEHKLVKPDGTVPCVLEAFKYEDGNLICLFNSMKHSIGDAVGYREKKSGYVQIRYGQKTYRVHRLIWEMHCGTIAAGHEIDHINGNKADNRIENLRLVSRAENAKNLKLQSRNTSGVSGVIYMNNKYRVTIGAKYLGYFDTIDEAIRARKSAEERNGYHVNHGRK